MLVNACVVLLASMATLFTLRAGMQFALLHELDQILSEDLSEVELAMAAVDDVGSSELREQLERKARGHIQHRWFVELLPMVGGIGPNAATSSSNPTDPADHDPLGWQSVNTPSFLREYPEPLHSPTTLEGYRIHTRTIGKGRGAVTHLRLGASLDLIKRDLALIDRIIGVTLVLGLIIAPLGGYALAGVATRPLEQIIRTADRLRPEQLDERLPVRDRGDELDQLSLAFNRLLDRIASFLERNGDFLANAAHELRTPLAALRSTAEVALRSERSASEYQELLATIIDESETLELLVNQLLLLAETEAGVDTVVAHGEMTDVGDLLEKACDMFAGVAESRSIELNCQTLPQVFVKGNRQHLRQVMNNLIDNAVKFTNSGGRVDVRLELGPAAHTARVTVRDTGVGIPPADQPRLFERFFRGERSHRRDLPTRGTGLGLSICEAVVKAHGGTIEVASELGSGSTFTVTLPLAAP
jgi:two-component system heavy metal sensor histidine kinase CusS